MLLPEYKHFSKTCKSNKSNIHVLLMAEPLKFINMVISTIDWGHCWLLVKHFRIVTKNAWFLFHSSWIVKQRQEFLLLVTFFVVSKFCFTAHELWNKDKSFCYHLMMILQFMKCDTNKQNLLLLLVMFIIHLMMFDYK